MPKMIRADFLFPGEKPALKLSMFTVNRPEADVIGVKGGHKCFP